MAKLYFRYSPMNSGKSTHLLQTPWNYKERNMKVLLLTSALDTRSGGAIASRIGIKEEAKPVKTKEDMLEIYTQIKENPVDAVFVDESQFLTKDMVDILGDVVDNYDIPVFCYGLKTDFATELFEGSERLLAIADSITELKSICKCGRKAIFNARLIDSKEQIVIGGEDIYETMCRKCYNRRNNASSM